MSLLPPINPKEIQLARWTARGLSLLFIGLILLFSVLNEDVRNDPTAPVVVMWFLALSMLMAWRWERFGGLLTLFLSLVFPLSLFIQWSGTVGIVTPLWQLALIALCLTLSFLIVGWLFANAGRQSQKTREFTAKEQLSPAGQISSWAYAKYVLLGSLAITSFTVPFLFPVQQQMEVADEGPVVRVAANEPPAAEAATQTEMATPAPTDTPAAEVTVQTQVVTAVPTRTPITTAIPESPAQVSRSLKTGIPQVDSVIDIVLSNDLNAREALVRFVTSGCTMADGLGSIPRCEEGQAEGTPVDYFPLGGPGEGHSVLASEVSRVLEFEADDLYAAYVISEDLPDEPEFPRGTYALFFTESGGESGTKSVVLRIDDEGYIVRLDGLGGMPLDYYFQQMAADLLDSPPEPVIFSSEAAEILVYPPGMVPEVEGAGEQAPVIMVTPPPELSPPAELPRPLYLLSTNWTYSSTTGEPPGVWRLDPGSSRIERITPPDLAVTSFDIWLGDGRFAYGTSEGQIHMITPKEQSILLYDAGLETDSVVEIGSLDWSPDGTRLAFTAHYRDRTEDDQYDGLWLLTLNEEAPVKLLNNRQFNPERKNVFEVRSAADVDWSPDGSALLLLIGYWEYSDILWLEPIISDPNEANLHDPPDLWSAGSWAIDGRSILLSDLDRGEFSNLARASRETESVDRILEGEMAQLAVTDAQELPAGITFLARDMSVRDGTSGHTPDYRLYLGHQLPDGFQYAPVGPDRALCGPSFIWDIAWEPKGQLAAVACYQGEVYLISLDGTVDLDLSPYLDPLGSKNPSELFWGLS